ncbi:MAG: lactoylglutathione lyase [Novosphingobium sp.]|nr:lactoylglutathione lyase [Novosphingobium sp.]
MPKMIFVNLPVADLPRARAFYEAIGFTNEPRFSDETAACMVWSEAIFVMLLTHPKWRSFTERPIPAVGASEVMLCIACDSRDEVNRMADAAGANGGTAEINPAQDHGFMMSRSFADPDGHVWEPMWMDPAVAEGEAHVSEATA